MQLTNINWIDCAIVAIIGISTLISLIRGFVREALSLTSWVIAFWISLRFYQTVSLYLEHYISDETIRMVVAFAVLFVITLILAGMVGYIISGLLDKTGLSGMDRMLGMLFGFGRGLLLVALVLLLARLTPLTQSALWSQAQLTILFQPLETWLLGFLPHDFDYNVRYLQPLPHQKTTDSA